MVGLHKAEFVPFVRWAYAQCSNLEKYRLIKFLGVD